MRMFWTAFAGIALAATLSACSQPETGIAAVASAMGSTNLNSIEYSGSGSLFGFGQAFEPGERWPRFDQRSYTASVNYMTPAMRLNSVRSQGEHPPRGGAAQPVAADQRAIVVVSGKNAWTEGGAQPAPNPGAVGDRLRALWATPHGVIKAAMANNGTLNGKDLTFQAEGRDFKATLNDQNLVEKVSYLSTNEVIGDYPIEITYADYADYGGVKFPKHIMISEDGFPTLDIMVDNVMPNAPVAIDVPEAVANAPAPPEVPEVKMDKLADGVWFMYASGIGSWAVEFKDFITVVEGPFGEARSLAVNDTIRKAFPNKPIKYVVNTHSHYDHAGGLRTYVAQDITVVTQEMNKPFFEKVWARPHTLVPDSLSKAPKTPMFETVDDKKVITDGTRSLEIYRLIDSRHHMANTMVFLPKEGLLYYGDGYNPPPGDDPRDPARTPEYGLDLYRNILFRNINVTRIAPAHTTRAVPYDNMKKAIGVLAVDTP